MTSLMEYKRANLLIKRYGIKSVDNKYVSSAEDAIRFAAGRPIAMKVISNKALHKTKSGLVKLNLLGKEDIRNAFYSLSKLAKKFRPYKIQVQSMIKGGLEIIIGGKTDPQFGKLILIGLGGVYVEVFRDFALRVCPISERDAINMLNQLKSKRIMAPDPSSEKMLIGLLRKVSRLLLENENILELDLNPLILHDGTYDAVDIRILE